MSKDSVFTHGTKRARFRVLTGMAATAVALSAVIALRGADLIEMQNGDRYAGKVLSVDSNNVVLRSDLLGKVTLPRSEVATITIGSGARTNSVRSRVLSTNGLPRPPAWTLTKTNAELAALLRRLGGDTNSMHQVQQEILNGAGAEANQKFNQMVGDLTSGKMGLDELRAQAKATLDQARSQRGDANGEIGALLDGYLTVLEDFLQQTAQEGAATNKPAQ